MVKITGPTTGEVLSKGVDRRRLRRGFRRLSDPTACGRQSLQQVDLAGQARHAVELGPHTSRRGCEAGLRKEPPGRVRVRAQRKIRLRRLDGWRDLVPMRLSRPEAA